MFIQSLIAPRSAVQTIFDQTTRPTRSTAGGAPSEVSSSRPDPTAHQQASPVSTRQVGDEFLPRTPEELALLGETGMRYGMPLAQLEIMGARNLLGQDGAGRAPGQGPEGGSDANPLGPPIEGVEALGPRPQRPRQRSAAGGEGGDSPPAGPTTVADESASTAETTGTAEAPASEGSASAPVDADGSDAGDEAEASEGEESTTEDASRPRGTDGEPLSDEEMQVVQDLELRDAEVRRHEQAHVAASGGHAQGGPSYDFEVGPDGKRYAVGGEVQIDTSAESSPEATIRKMQTVRRAALAPAEPSSQDRRVAAQAAQRESQARQELVQQQLEGEQEIDRAETESGPEETRGAEASRAAEGAEERPGRNTPTPPAPAGESSSDTEGPNDGGTGPVQAGALQPGDYDSDAPSTDAAGSADATPGGIASLEEALDAQASTTQAVAADADAEPSRKPEADLLARRRAAATAYGGARVANLAAQRAGADLVGALGTAA